MALNTEYPYDGILDGPWTSAVAFADFIEPGREPYHTWLRRTANDGQRPRALLDIVFVWLINGDAAEVCPTYDSYVLTVLDIIQLWMQGDKTTVCGFPLLPNGEGEPATPVELLIDPDHEPFDYRATFDEPYPLSKHPALSREGFLYRQQSLARGRSENLAKDTLSILRLLENTATR
jgi:hypothetical protein